MKTALLLTLALIFSPLAEATERSSAQVRLFRKLNACPSGPDRGSHTRCAGHVVDHIKALDCGGRDVPSNMQYQTITAALAKDKWERSGPGCKHRTHAQPNA